MATSLMAQLFDRPIRGLWYLIAAQVAFWTLAPALSHNAPPLDVVEMYAWGREGVVATFKHPNLPGLVLEAARLVGLSDWHTAFAVSQIFIAITFAAVFALGRELMDEKRALVGTLLLTGLYFFSWPTPEFNHNVAQMPFWALTAWMLWRATSKGEWWAWALLGLFGALSIWAKYSSGVLLIVAAAWILWDAQARRSLLKPGPYIALVVFGAVITPQILWLFENAFQPFSYAARRAARDASLFAPLEFLLTQMAHHLPMLIVLACAGWFGAKQADAPARPEQRPIRFLLLMGLGPTLLVIFAALFAGAGLKGAWGAAMYNLSGLLIVALLWDRVSDARMRRVAWGAAILIVTLSGLYFGHMRYGAAVTGDPLRGNWPQARISEALEAAWREDSAGAPLRIVAGDIWTAGLVGMNAADPPSVWINSDLAISPWITEDDVARHGALFVWRDDEPSPAGAEPWQIQATGRITVPVADAPGAEPIRISYFVLPPGAAPAE